MAIEKPQRDHFYFFLNRRWDCRNLVTLYRYVDDVVCDENKIEYLRCYFECYETGEGLQINEDLFRALDPIEVPDNG